MNYACLRGKEIMNYARMQDYSEWAMGLLGDGIESTNVAVLAGFAFEKHAHPADIHEYFQRSVEELELAMPTNDECVKAFARSVCNEVVRGEVSPTEGLDELNYICIHLEYAEEYLEFYHLHDEIVRLQHPDLFAMHEEINATNFDSYAIAEARKFLKESGGFEGYLTYLELY